MPVNFRALPNNEGSATVEAALVFPLIIAIAAFFISFSSVELQNIKTYSIEHDISIVEPAQEKILRGVWIISE